jgi:hypothetical protein
VRAFARNNVQNGTPNVIQKKKGDESFFGVQAKLSIGKPDDKYEREADSVADQVVGKSSRQGTLFGGGSFFSGSPKPMVQRLPFEEVQKKDESEEIQEKTIAQTITPVVQLATEEEDNIQEKCDDCETETSTVQKKTESNNTEAPSHFESKLHSSKGGGAPMQDATRTQMEQGFGANFSNVRIHTNSNAVQMNKDIGAQAFTNKSDIYFNEGKYDPGSTSGQKLLAHELTHTIQQSSAEPAEVQTQLSENLIQLNDMLDSWDVPEEDVITKCGELTPGDKAIVIAGGYRSRMASALNISEMVRAVTNLDAALSTQLEWVNDAAFTTNSIDYSDIQTLVTSAEDAEREVLKTNYWKEYFVSVCDNETMITALDHLKFDLATKLTWLNAEMTITSWELNYSDIQPWIVHANTTVAEKNALKTPEWRSFFIDVCDNETIITALDNLEFDLVTKLTWLQQEVFITSWELNYETIQPWIVHANTSQTERDSLKVDWLSFFVDICDNETMVTALDELKFDLATKLTWINEEMTVTSWELDYSTIKPWIIHANTTQPERDALNTETWISFFVDVCTENNIVEAVNDLNFDQPIKVTWIIAETVGVGSNLTFPFTDADEAILAEHRSNAKLAEALKLLFTPTEFANAVVEFILIVRSDLVDPPAAEAEAIRILSIMLGNEEMAKNTMLSSMIAVIIPRNKLLTDLPQFAHLAGVDTFDGRDWEKTRGVRSGDKVALAEENLLGGAPTATFEGNPVGGAYPTGYSTATHEFAHGLHVNIMNDEDKAIITAAFEARKVSALAAPTDANQWVDGREGCYASQNEREFFAQLSNAYLGVNTGTDAATGDPRHNGAAWVLANEPTVHAVLTTWYGGNTVPNANP